MTRHDFSSEEIIEALSRANFHKVRRTGSHVILKYNHPSGETRVVTVPIQDRIAIGTLRQIADASGANSFSDWCEWIENLLDDEE